MQAIPPIATHFFLAWSVANVTEMTDRYTCGVQWHVVLDWGTPGDLRAQWPWQGDEHPAYAPEGHGRLYLYRGIWRVDLEVEPPAKTCACKLLLSPGKYNIGSAFCQITLALVSFCVCNLFTWVSSTCAIVLVLSWYIPFLLFSLHGEMMMSDADGSRLKYNVGECCTVSSFPATDKGCG